MRKSKLIEKPDGGVIIDDSDESCAEPPMTPEETRRGRARLDSFAKYCDERCTLEIPDQAEREKVALARHEERLAAIEVQYEKEVQERSPEEVRRAEAWQAAHARFSEERRSLEVADEDEREDQAFANYGKALAVINARFLEEVRELMPEEIRRAAAKQAASDKFHEERHSPEIQSEYERFSRAFSNYSKVLEEIDIQCDQERSERKRAEQEKER